MRGRKESRTKRNQPGKGKWGSRWGSSQTTSQHGEKAMIGDEWKYRYNDLVRCGMWLVALTVMERNKTEGEEDEDES